MKSYIIAPSILSADFTRLGEQIAEAESAGADWIHMDVMDGHFVPNLTMGPVVVEACRRATSLPLDVHLMIEHPENLLEAFAQAGASSLIVHVETCPDITGTLKIIRSLGCKAGVTLNPATPASDIEPALMLVDQVLVMTVHPGYSGQEFIPEILSKVAEIRRRLDESHSPAWLEVDGGITAANISRVRDAGANAFVAANAIFHHPDGIEAGIRSLRKAVTT
ncbi:MAG TPA: ribulose-phosphate 3-epimerase [Anaerolineales bacterium]